MTADRDSAQPPGYSIWRAWRDGMLAQGRFVDAIRMSWETLPREDRELDATIEAAVRQPTRHSDQCYRIGGGPGHHDCICYCHGTIR